MSSSADFSVVVQGPICSSAETPGRRDLTIRCLASIREYLPHAEIVLSTWEGAAVEGLDYDVLVQSRDPGAVSTNDTDRAGLLNNVNRQIVSTRAGLLAARRKYAIKFRGDLRFESSALLGWSSKLDEKSDGKFLNAPVLLCSYLTVNPRRLPLLFHFSDLMQAGRTDDLRKLWSIPLAPEPESSRWLSETSPPWTIPPATRVYRYRYCPEQYLAIAFLQSCGEKVSLAHPSDIPPLLALRSEQALLDHFMVLDLGQMGVVLPSRLALTDSQVLYGHADWERLREAYRRRITRWLAQFSLIAGSQWAAVWMRCLNWAVSHQANPLYQELRRWYRQLKSGPSSGKEGHPVARPSIHREWLARALLTVRPRAGANARRYRLCIYRPDGIGDFLLASGAMRRLLRDFSPESTLIVANPETVDLARSLFPGVEVVPLPTRNHRAFRDAAPLLLRLRGLFKGIAVEKLVCFRYHRTFFDEMILHFFDADSYYGISETPLSPRNPSFPAVAFEGEVAYPLVEEAQAAGTCCDLLAHSRVLSLLLGRDIGYREILPELHARSSTKRRLLVAPFSREKIKNLEAPFLIPILKILHDRFHLPLFLCGSPGQREMLEDLASPLRKLGVAEVHLLTPPSFLQFTHEIGSADIFLTADTSTAHLATACDLPNVTVIGGGHYGLCMPWSRSFRQQGVTHVLECFHCNWHCLYPEPYCTTRVPVDQVVAAFERALSNGGSLE